MINRLIISDSSMVIKFGAVIATIGTISLVFFAVGLLAFPVSKSCISSNNNDNRFNNTNCSYVLTAPPPFSYVIQPLFLVVTLLIIAGGITIIRIGKWKQNNNTNNSSR